MSKNSILMTHTNFGVVVGPRSPFHFRSIFDDSGSWMASLDVLPRDNPPHMWVGLFEEGSKSAELAGVGPKTQN